MGKVLITRHDGLVEYLQEQGIVPERIIPHATPEDVAGQEVVGVLPLQLAAQAKRVTVVELNPPPAFGEDLPKEEVARRAQGIETYVVVDASRCKEVAEEMAEYYPNVPRGLVDEAAEAYLSKTARGTVGVARSQELATLTQEAMGGRGYLLEGEVGVNDVYRRRVWGALPLPLAAQAAEVVAPEFNLRPEERGQRLSAEELAARVEWRSYTVFPAAEFDRRMGLLEEELALRESLAREGERPETERVLREARERILKWTEDPDAARTLSREGVWLRLQNVEGQEIWREALDREVWLAADAALVRRGREWTVEDLNPYYATYAPRVHSLEEVHHLTEGYQLSAEAQSWLATQTLMAIPAERALFYEGRVLVYEDADGMWHAVPPEKHCLLTRAPVDAVDPSVIADRIDWSDTNLLHGPRSAEPSWRQWERAFDLAKEHRHHWATVEKTELQDILAVSRSNAEVESRLWIATRDSLGPVGGIYPEFDEKGNLVHTTTTGRLSWKVEPDGAVDLCITRPGTHPVQGHVWDISRPVARGRLNAEPGAEWQLETSSDALSRHATSLLNAADAVKPVEPEARAALWAQIEKNETMHTDYNLYHLERRFGTLTLAHLAEAFREGTIDQHRFLPRLEHELGRESVKAFQYALHDTPSIAERIREYTPTPFRQEELEV